MKFSDKLASLRKTNNLSQEQLAEKLDVSRQSVSKWESGDTYPDMSKMIQLCNILNCKLPDLMDDGTFGDDFSNKEKKNTFSSYIKNFLDYVTKSYNMFIHMDLKAKLTCFIEMLVIGIVLSILISFFPDLLWEILDKVFRYIPYGRSITSILTDICTIGFIILGIMIFFHLFKIRYLDYYVTVEDSNVDSQIIEEPIEENKANNNRQAKKEKLVIRDPKHSISYFLDGIAKVLQLILKIFFVLCCLPALFAAIGGTFLAVIMFANANISNIFLFSSISIIGITIISFIIVYMAINYCLKRTQPYKVLIALFLTSLLLIGAGAGFVTNKILDLNHIDGNKNIELLEENIIVDEEEISNGLDLYIDGYNYEKVIDENINGVIVKISHPKNMKVISNDMGKNGLRNVKGIHFDYSSGLIPTLKMIKDDLSSNNIRDSYEPIDFTSITIRMSSSTAEKVFIEEW